MLPQQALKMVRKLELTYPLLADRENRVAASYGLVYHYPDYLKEAYLGLGIDLTRFNGENSWSLPMPARYLINRRGIIRDARVSPDYTERPDPEVTLAKLRELSANP